LTRLIAAAHRGPTPQHLLHRPGARSAPQERDRIRAGAAACALKDVQEADGPRLVRGFDPQAVAHRLAAVQIEFRLQLLAVPR
jgi:hypothetical protein